MSFWLETGANFGGTDEWYTPKEAVFPIVKYLKPGAKILCPFDTAESNFVKVFQSEGFEVSYSHIKNGVDFFDLPKPDADYVISNPPYSLRQEVLRRLYEWEIPFAMILNANGLFDSQKRFDLASVGGAEILYLYPRVNFIDVNGKSNHSNFQSVYWCKGILPNKIAFERLDQQLILL